MSSPTQEQIARLPKWAIEYIADCERERDEANRLLTRTLDDQTPSPFYSDDLRGAEPSNGSRSIRRYFDTTQITAEEDGVKLQMILPRGIQGRHGIEIKWGGLDHDLQDVVFQPTGFQSARLFIAGVKK